MIRSHTIFASRTGQGCRKGRIKDQIDECAPKSYMKIVRGEVIDFFRHFYDHGAFNISFNASFIALIPKTGGAAELKDFRPINLVRFMYNLFS